MKNYLIKILIVLFICLSSIASWASTGTLYGFGVPVDVEFTVSPNKKVYYEGETVNVDVHIYFDREPVWFEIGKEYLIIGRFTKGSKVRALGRDKYNSSQWTTLQISESTFKDSLFYFSDSDKVKEIHGSFKIVIPEEIRRIALRASGYTLGKYYFNGKLASLNIIINGEDFSYFGSRTYEYYRFPKEKAKPEKIPLIVSYEFSSKKDGYEAGDIVSANLTITFPLERKFEEDEKYLILCPYMVDKKILTINYNKPILSGGTTSNLSPAYVIESSLQDSFFIFETANDVFKANFKIEIIEKTHYFDIDANILKLVDENINSCPILINDRKYFWETFKSFKYRF